MTALILSTITVLVVSFAVGTMRRPAPLEPDVWDEPDDWAAELDRLTAELPAARDDLTHPMPMPLSPRDYERAEGMVEQRPALYHTPPEAGMVWRTSGYLGPCEWIPWSVIAERLRQERAGERPAVVPRQAKARRLVAA